MANTTFWKSRTQTPAYVYAILAVLFILGGVGFYKLLGWHWGGTIWGVILAFTTGIYTIKVPEYRAQTLLDALTGKQRTVLQGRSAKLPWEGLGTLVDMRAELKDIAKETWATAQGAQMDAKYVYILHPTVDDEAVIAYAGFHPDAVKMAARNLFTMMLSDHFGKTENPETLLIKGNVNRAVFETPEGQRKIVDFEVKYGVTVSSVALEDVDYDERTQKARSMITNATSFEEAVGILVKQMSKEEAVRVAKLMNFDTVSEVNWNVQAPDLKNLRNISILGGLTGGAGGAKGRKGPKK